MTRLLRVLTAVTLGAAAAFGAMAFSVGRALEAMDSAYANVWRLLRGRGIFRGSVLSCISRATATS